MLPTDLASADDAFDVADRISAVLAGVHVVDGHALALPASVGVATTRWNATTADELLRRADAAMYEAKRAGRGRWASFDSPRAA